MGLLVDGKWHDQWYDTKKTDGKFERSASQFRNWITKDGCAGPTGKAGFAAEKNRYHLYVSLACPWAHRTLIFREIKGLQNFIDISVTHWLMADNGWTFKPDTNVIPDTINNADYLYETYLKADKHYSGRVTVPVLWDKQQQTIVSNESSEIIRMFNSAFDGIGANDKDFYPHHLQEKINDINEKVYNNINNGVYKAGFATTQEAYDKAVTELFDALNWIEEILSSQEYLVNDQLTEADWRLFTTLIRFDPVYHGHFKCNLKQLKDFKHINLYVNKLYHYPGVKNTINFEHIKKHYYQSHTMINPTGIVPKGPTASF